RSLEIMNACSATRIEKVGPMTSLRTSIIIADTHTVHSLRWSICRQLAGQTLEAAAAPCHSD
ncbi:MAG TPA: hypothetical protein VIK18_24385, partial [Pirellulales bacterium]